jgi:23S rRNA (cytidine1920-2'-O)/16S rRNA (cytidine1409-2'-O)-methyltransferase
LDRFRLDPSGLHCLDAGASTGGFTDCLLQRGAARVVAVDVGYGQLAWRLRTDHRVIVLERTNVRELEPSMLPFRPELLAADLSFISLRAVLPALAGVAAPDALVIVLVKPQFEADRFDVGKGGVVRHSDTWRRVLEKTAAAGHTVSLTPRRAMASPLLGPAGNVEFFLLLGGGGDEASLDLDAAVEEGRSLGRTS